MAPTLLHLGSSTTHFGSQTSAAEGWLRVEGHLLGKHEDLSFDARHLHKKSGVARMSLQASAVRNGDRLCAGAYCLPSQLQIH